MVVPLRGDAEYARRTREAFSRLELGPADELIVVDNSDAPVAEAELSAVARVVRAAERRSSYHARNAGAAAARGECEWLLFVDADCLPAPDLLDRYFARPIPEECGAVAGAIVGSPSQDSLLARYARDRGFYDQRTGLHGLSGNAAATGNLLVRRGCFERLGGFEEGIRSGGDVDFCLRMANAGWRLEHRMDAVVAHRHREDLVSFLAMIARYGAGARWLADRHPQAAARPWPLLTGLVWAGRDIGGHLLRGRFAPAAFRALDGAGLLAHTIGYRAGNEAGRLRSREVRRAS